MRFGRCAFPLAAFAALVCAHANASALPRFAARNGNECIQCHVNPTGGGMRNGYGRNVFEKNWLPRLDEPESDEWIAEDGERYASDEEKDDVTVSFSGDLNRWLAIGADFRTAYIYVRPDRGFAPDEPRDVTNTFFLMQADLYHAATLNDHITLVLDVGIYSGFEAWGLYRLRPPESSWNLYVKVGRFMPAFGIREVEHQLFTREGVGLGNTDRDTGVELTTYVGPLTANFSLLNGTLGDAALDSRGNEREAVEKAYAARVSARTERGWFRAQLGTSWYYNQNNNSPNPLFGATIPSELQPEVSAGVDELRAGMFLTANLGRFTYLGDLVYVRNTFHSDRLSPLRGYASYQELSFLPTQGLDFVTTLEFADSDMDLIDTSAARAGFVVEYFPWAFTELRAMVRRSWSDQAPTGGAWDAVLFVHLFM